MKFNVLICSLMLVATGLADSFSMNGATITYSNAERIDVGNDVVLVYSNANTVGSLSFPSNLTAKTRMLVVGGGGAGGTIGSSVTYGATGGGGAGGAIDQTLYLDGGEYQIFVGQGGEKAQSAKYSWVGADGGLTYLGDSEGEYIIAAKGGGGGGTILQMGKGNNGGSGGGGSWYTSTLFGGSGIANYGHDGGTPTDFNLGGGGGGAGSNGYADGNGGSGLVNDITGTSNTYAKGGNGGSRYNPVDATNGLNPGDGGNGTMFGVGGSGAAGILIVRFSKVFEYTIVDAPSVETAFGMGLSNPGRPTSNDRPTSTSTNIVAFNLSEFRYLNDAVDSITGTTNVPCQITCTRSGKNNYRYTYSTNDCLGRYTYTISLKDEYMWADGTTEPKTFAYRVKPASVIGNSTVSVTKTVEWSEGTNATIAITAHSTPEAEKVLPKVLFLGTLCSSHGLSLDVVNSSLTAAAKNAELVDYYLFNSSGQQRSGSLTTGQSGSVSFSMGRGQHKALSYFYSCLYTILSDVATSNKYEYIIFEFDGTRLAHGYSTSTYEKQVSEFLRTYYENNKVIWIVDHCTNESGNEPWASDYWRPNTYLYSAGDMNLTAAQWKGLVGMFAPLNYNANGSNYTDMGNVISKSVNGKTYYATDRYEYQADYTNPQQVADLISGMIKPISYTLGLNDNIHIDLGLELKNAYGQWTTNQVDWYELDETNLTPNEGGVSVNLPEITTEAWLKLYIDISDTGSFLTSEGAKWNNGKWTKNPNDGPVQATIFPDGNRPAIIDEDEADTEVEWEFSAKPVTVEIVHGEGSTMINGFNVTNLYVNEENSANVIFEPDENYVIDYLEVDGIVIDDFEDRGSWFFNNVVSEHNVKVGFVKKSIERIIKLWITDHFDAGNGYVNLAFKPTMAGDFALNQETLNRWKSEKSIKVKCARTEDGLKDAVPFDIVDLLDGTGSKDLDKGWVWITVKSPDGYADDSDDYGWAWKIVIEYDEGK